MSTKRQQNMEYYLGLDMGTDSIGWAVTDLNYNLLRFHQKNMWGSHLFEAAQPAATRRVARSARRRLGRRHQRLQLLEELFAEEISKVDQTFFLRMKESKYYDGDKAEPIREEENILFADESYTDAEYFKDYKTIYHLRKSLIEGGKKYDIRLYYLALHHIMKNRGHFLFEGQDMKSITSFSGVYQEIVSYLQDEYDIDFSCGEEAQIAEIMKDRSLGVLKKSTQLNKLLDAGKDKQKKAIIKLLAGGVVALADIFEGNEFEECEVKKISFTSSNYDADILTLEDENPECLFLIQKLKALYDWGVLANIIGHEKYLSFAKVKIYEKHKKDLALLKKIIRSTSCFSAQDYRSIFVDLDKNKANYAAYVGKICKDGKKKPTEKIGAVRQDDLCKFLLKYINKIPESEIDEDVQYVKTELENGTFLPKQVSTENGVIPYQLHLQELRAILNNMEKDYAFLGETKEDGYSVKEKIELLFTFRIPYYVGPLNDAHAKEDFTKGNCWVAKNSKEKIYPWNFREIVDLEESAQRFIRRMTNKCTYLIGEDVIPKQSLLYSEYMVWNELNNVKIDQEKLPIELKKKIFKDVFQEGKITGKVTLKKLNNYLVAEGYLEKGEKHELSGIDEEFKASLTSYRDMKKILGRKVDTDREMVEDIIVGILLFGDDKKLLKNRLRKRYVETGRLTEEELKGVLKKSYTGWGRFSKQFLNGIEGASKQTGECGTIMHLLKETNENLMQLLSDNYTFLEEIERYNADKMGTNHGITYEMVDELYVSPSVKRMIWQSLTIVKEINKIMGHEPKKVFVEMAREKEELGDRKASRKQKLLDLYKSCEAEERNWKEELEEKSESAFRAKNLYLYYTQMGRCMYCGKQIGLGEINNQNLYDRDHIYPRAKTKDDSMDNLVLVCKGHNQNKQDVYPLDINIQTKMKAAWKMLKEKGFISTKKYERLVRTSPLSDEELSGFIGRQLVETRQSTKAVAEILQKVYEEAEVVYVKGGNVSSFRKDNNFMKVREINDYHHAQDAYLNIVVGNVYHTKFTKNPLHFLRDKTLKENERKYSLYHMFEHDVERNGVVAWKKGNNGTIKTVEQVMKMNLSRRGSIQFTRYAFEKHGELFDQMLMKKGKGQVPIKGNDARLSIEKYGGYNKASVAYFMLVESSDKKGRIRTLEGVPVYLKKQLEESEEARMAYCIDVLGLKEPRILIDKIKINSLLVIDGYPMHISGKSGNQILMKNALQLYLDLEIVNYLKEITGYYTKNQERMDKKTLMPVGEKSHITAEQNLNIYDILLDKHANTLFSKRASSQVATLEKGRERFVQLSLEEQCLCLYEILHLFQANASKTNLATIGGSPNAGVFMISKNLSKCQTAKLVHQSPTGLFQQEIDLLSL